MTRTVVLATLVAGTLDILFAVCLSLFFGRDPMNMLRYVASGPFPPATEWGTAGSALGLLVHFSLMWIMATFYFVLTRIRPQLIDKPIIGGIAYGLVTYVAMNWLVVPLRFDTPLPPKSISIATQLFAHVVLVGIPIALITAHTLRPRSVA